MPSPPPLQQLDQLDRSSPDFPHRLDDVLHRQEYKRCAQNLQGDDVEWLADFLDEALTFLDPSSPAFRKCLRELRSICGSRGILPTSYTISSHLLHISVNPFASGGYGDVYQGTLDGVKICIKRMRVYTQEGVQGATKAFCKEAVTWKRLTHPNIVPLLGITLTPFQLISNWMFDDLPKYIKQNSDANRLELISDAARGLCYLHSCSVIHGDLKGSNILVDDTGHARIADFGLAAVTEGVDSERSASGDRSHAARWTAPEILTEQWSCSTKTDVFSFAMVMTQVFTGVVPFHDKSPAAAVFTILSGGRPPRPEDPTVTENLWILMNRCWAQDPFSRPDISEVLQALCTPDLPAWRSLVDPTLAIHERVSAIETIFSEPDEIQVVENLSGEDAKVFIDVIDEELNNLPQHTRRLCLHSLSKIFGRQALLPKSLETPLFYDQMETVQLSSEFSDVWKGRYNGREVAAKALRINLTSDIERIRERFYKEVVGWKTLCHPNVLPLMGVTIIENRFVVVSEWMKNGNVNEFVKAHPNVDRLELLIGATEGLIYIHDQGIIHGNVRGVNILINHDGRACISDTSLLIVISDPCFSVPSCGQGSKTPWMSPELLDPARFNLEESRPTKKSDCYAMGMVIYEILSGQTPYAPSEGLAVVRQVLDGELPERPQGALGVRFTDGIWWTLELCWKPQPDDRPSLKAVLRFLQDSTQQPRPSHMDGDAETEADHSSDAATIDDSGPSIAHSTTSNLDLTITRGEGELPVSELCIPPDSSTSPAIPPDGRPQTVNPKRGWTRDRMMHIARRISRAATRKLGIFG